MGGRGGEEGLGEAMTIRPSSLLSLSLLPPSPLPPTIPFSCPAVQPRPCWPWRACSLPLSLFPPSFSLPLSPPPYLLPAQLHRLVHVGRGRLAAGFLTHVFGGRILLDQGQGGGWQGGEEEEGEEEGRRGGGEEGVPGAGIVVVVVVGVRCCEQCAGWERRCSGGDEGGEEGGRDEEEEEGEEQERRGGGGGDGGRGGGDGGIGALLCLLELGEKEWD